MGKLRHVSIAVPDLVAAAEFYEKTFDLERVKESERSISLSDGTMNITLTLPMDLDSTRCSDFVGIHHLGFVVDNKQEATDKVVRNGGRAGDGKCWDPNEIIVNVQERYWAGSR